MPRSRHIRHGILTVGGTALLWAGYQVTNLSLTMMPWTGGVGALTIFLGLVMEAKKTRAFGAKKSAPAAGVGAASH